MGKTMDAQETARLRQRLLSYPGATEESVDEQLYAFEQRQEEKEALISGRGMSNAMAETFLDRKGYPRPPGWHSVFFYPGSNRPRNKFLFLTAVVALPLYLML
jgi:hypothetical protein